MANLQEGWCRRIEPGEATHTFDLKPDGNYTVDDGETSETLTPAEFHYQYWKTDHKGRDLPVHKQRFEGGA